MNRLLANQGLPGNLDIKNMQKLTPKYADNNLLGKIIRCYRGSEIEHG